MINIIYGFGWDGMGTMARFISLLLLLLRTFSPLHIGEYKAHFKFTLEAQQ